MVQFWPFPLHWNTEHVLPSGEDEDMEPEANDDNGASHPLVESELVPAPGEDQAAQLATALYQQAPEDGEDEEEARKRRIAEKIAKMGGCNPFAAAASVGMPSPPPRRPGELSRTASKGEEGVAKQRRDLEASTESVPAPGRDVETTRLSRRHRTSTPPLPLALELA
jgi:hypothetical protein